MSTQQRDSDTRKLFGRDDLRLGVMLNIPLYQGNRIDARLARELAQNSASTEQSMA